MLGQRGRLAGGLFRFGLQAHFNYAPLFRKGAKLRLFLTDRQLGQKPDSATPATIRELNRKVETTMHVMRKILLATTVAAGFLAMSAISASAYIACTGTTCWHVKEKYTYPATAGVVVHEDAWKPTAGITFREHTGRGFWKGDVWTDF